MEGCAAGSLIGADVVVVRGILGGDQVAESVLSGGSFEDYFYGNIEGISPGEGDPMGVS